MINSLEDLKNRTLVESNILKSFILSQIGGVKNPDRDDIMIHDYQIANSVTINSILSNYIVNLKYAWELYNNHDESSNEKYFKIVQKLDEDSIAALTDETRLILDVSDGDGTFKSRRLKFAIRPVAITEGTRKFVNLDTVWYGVVDRRSENGEWDEIEIVDDMNDFYVNPNPFGGDVNPFACPLYSGNSVRWGSFNEFLKASKTRVNCIVENLFRNNPVYSGSDLGSAIANCQYIVCTTNRLYGLRPRKSNKGEFKGFQLIDIGALVNNIDNDQYFSNQFQFLFCGFHVVSDTCTFFLVFSDQTEFHYVYFNEGTYDQTYGFAAMKTIAVDQLIVDVKQVFRSIESIKSLDSVTIVLTDYGFWDIEPNQTDYITYSYCGTEKEYNVIEGDYQARGDKVVLPTTVLGDADKVVEYDKVWKLSGSQYTCEVDGSQQARYLKELVGERGERHQFAGGTETFAMYNSLRDGDSVYPAYILTKISQEQFNSLLFSTPGLVTPFFKWLYARLVQQAVDGVHGGEGEYYLWSNNPGIVKRLYDVQNNSGTQSTGQYRLFNNYSFQLPRAGSADPLDVQAAQLVGAKFSSIYELMGRPANLYSFCTALHNLSSGSIGWLFSKASDNDALAALRECMFSSFKVDYQEKVDQLAETVLDDLTKDDGYPLLSYFRKYLKDKLLEDMAGDKISQEQSRILENQSSVDKVVADVVQYIRNSTVTASILGDPSHAGIQSYLYQNRVLLSRREVLAIMSPSNALAEMTLAVQSMPFFKEHTDYQKLLSNKDRDDLFTIRQNVEFASKSGLAGDDGSLAVDWNEVKNWIFGGEVTEESLVRAFMRTQFYRPLFFKADNYDMFTEDENLYKCETDMFYVNHNGVEHELVLDNGRVDLAASRLTRGDLGGSCEVTSATYLNTNILEYSLKYDEVSVVGNKFVLEDMEFFVLRPVAESNEVNSVCFNVFQKETQPSNDQLEIVDNKFTLNGVEYEIEGESVVSVDSATQMFDENANETDANAARYKEFKGEIDKGGVDRIRIDGVWYVLEKEENEYRWLKYADIDDNKLVEVPIDYSGYGTYGPMNLHIQFNSTWDKVNIVKDYQIQVINRLKDEWCVFDSKHVEFDEEQSYDWYLANEIQWMMDNYPQKAAGIDLLGHGVLYSGGLMNASYVLEVESEMRNGYAMTKGVLVKTMSGTGEVVRQDIGTLFNGSLAVDQNKVFAGKIAGNLVEKDSDNGDMTIILKNSSEKLNNCNAVWMSKTPVDSWKNAWSLQSVGMVVPYEDEDGGAEDTFENEDASLSSLKIEFDLNLESSPDFVVLDPVIEVDQNDSTNKQVSKYRVRIREDGIGTFDAVKINDYVHIVVDGVRYRINISTMDVEKFMFNPIEVKTMDFSTQYTASRLRENLLSNIKQYMMNQLVEKLILHPSTGGTGSNISNGEITMVPRSIDKYIDLFPIDVEKEIFSSVRAVDLDSKEASKFVEAYSSNMRDIDDSYINSGNAYKFLEEKVKAAFFDGQSYQSVLLVLDEHSIDVTRVDHTDKFTYRIHFDLHLRASKKILEGIEDQDVKGKYIIGNAVLEDIVCEARFIPTYAYPQSQSDLSKSMKYKVQYQIVEGDYQGYYDQIIYVIEEKARVKTIDPRAISTHLSVPAYPAQFQQNELDNITDELAEFQIQKMITDAIVRSIVVSVNNSLQESQRPTTQVQYNILQNEIYPAVNGVWPLYNDAPDEAIFKDEGRATIDGTIYNVVREGDGYILQEDGGDARLDIINRIANGTKTIQSHDSITGGIKDVVLAVSSQPVVSQADIATAFEFGTYELTTFETPEDGGSVSTINYLKFKDNKFRGSNQPGIQQMAFNYRDLNNLEAVCSSNGSSPSGEYDFVKDPEDQSETHSFKIDGWSLNYTDADVDSYEGSEEDEEQSEEDPDAQTVVGGSIIATVGQGLTEEDDFQFNGVESRDVHDQLDCFLAPDSNGVFSNWTKTIEYTLAGGDKWFGKAGKFKVTVFVDGRDLTEFWNNNTSAAGSVEGDSNEEGSDETAEQEAPQLNIQIELVESQPAWEFQDPLIKQTAKFATTLIKYELNDSEIFRNIVGDFQLATEDDKEAAASGVDGEDAPQDSEPPGDLPPDDEGGGEETDSPPKYIVPSFTFQIRIKKSRYSVYLNSIGTGGADGQFDSALSYVFGNTYYDGDANRVENIIPVTDLIGDSIVGTYTTAGDQQVHYNFGYGYMNYPTNLDTAEDFQGLEFMKIFAEISSDNIIQDGYYCPCTVQVINPNQVSSVQGDIYNRYFETEQRVYVDHFSGLTTDNISIDGSKKDVWLDSAATIKSIRGKSTSDRWKLIVNTSDSSGNPTDSEDLFVPSSMRKKVSDLVFETLKLDESYFKTMLEQFKTFLSTVNSELNQDERFSTWDSNAIRDICKFKYDATVTYSKYAEANDNWNKDGGLFEDRNEKYRDCLDSFQTHMYNEFYNDFQTLAKRTDLNIAVRDYNNILVEKIGWNGIQVNYSGTRYSIRDSYDGIYEFRSEILMALYENRSFVQSEVDLISEVFGDKDSDVRYINRIKTSIFGDVDGNMYVADGNCHVLAKQGSTVNWYEFNSGQGYMDALLENKRANAESYVFQPQIQQTEYPISVDQSQPWRFKFANRDLSAVGSRVVDAFVLRCSQTGGSSGELWYLSSLGAYLYAPSGLKIVDMAYEQHGESVYVLFSDDSGAQDHYLYRFDNLLDRKDSQGKILLQKELASMKIETFHSVDLTDKELKYDSVYLDYSGSGDSWTISLYGRLGESLHDVEVWRGNPGQREDDFRQYNVLLFGDTLFSADQLKFQNISKNKEMFDILDINEVDGCYYGLFKDELGSTDEETIYTVFKTAPSYTDARGVERTGVVQRLPYRIVDPNMYRTNGDLYSLYVVEKTADGTRQLREISVPDSDIYIHRTIPLQSIMEGMKKDGDSELSIHQMIMSEFIPGSGKTSFFVLSNWGEGFHKVYYTNDFSQLSIDYLDGVDNDGNPVGLNDRLLATLREKVIRKHVAEKHDAVDYFKVVSSKVNQFAENFTTFSLVPTEFSETQDIGVIPDSKVDDTDKASDHRKDSLQVSTDILWTDGMLVGSDANPGLVTAAVSNPATTYDSVYVFLKSQRNPSIEGTEFYDYITDADGNELMNLYAIPFIYRVNTNNTYDLYINIPTTRTKYLNRMTGTLKDDGTTQVQKDDYSTRRNFLDEPMPNNLDESTTKLRVYIDRKFISIGNIELVEISGNSIPLQIYRDSANNGLYDSIALESRWNGEVVELNEPDKDINKVMLEFECYGTDSQSIHIQGKTLINHVLDDKKYKYA